MTALHDLSATELIARYRERSLSPVEVTRAVLDRIAALGAAPARDLRARPRRRARARRASREARWLRHVSAGANVGALEGVPTMIKENIATAGTPLPLGTAATELVAGAARRAAGGAPARGRRGGPRQDDDARLRDAVVGAVELPRPDPQSLGPEQEPGRQQLGRGRRRRRRLRAAPPRHRHRRLGAPAGRMVRRLHPEAEPRPDSDRSAVRRPRRRADDAHRRRRGADDGRARASPTIATR